MKGKQTNEFDVKIPADTVWYVYSTLILPDIVKKIPNLFQDLKVTGDGSVGTTFDIYMFPGAPFSWFKERIVTLDKKHYVKEVQTVEGGVLTLGYTSFKTRFEIIKKGKNLTTVKSSYTYEINDADSANESGTNVSSLGTILKAVVAYLQNNPTTSAAPEANPEGLPEKQSE